MALNETNHQNNVGKNMKYGKLQTTIFEATFTQLCAAKLEDNLDFSHIYEYVHNTHFLQIKDRIDLELSQRPIYPILFCVHTSILC